MKYLTPLALVCLLALSCKSDNSASTDQVTKKEFETATPYASTTVAKSEASTQAPSLLQGIDISHYQTGIDWMELENELSFVFIKATAGVTYTDPSFESHWSKASKTDLLKGAYHFYYTADDPVQQAEFFIDQVLNQYQGNNLPPVIDIETDGINTDITPTQLHKDVLKFLTVIEKAFQRTPILYTSHSFAEKYLNNDEFDKYYLWIAEYGVDQPKIPTAWTSKGWTFWQNSASAKVKGVSTEVDHDVFKGSKEDLNNL